MRAIFPLYCMSKQWFYYNCFFKTSLINFTNINFFTVHELKLRPRHTMRQVAATRRRDRLLQQMASCDMWKSLSLRSVAQIQTGLNFATYRSDKLSASDLSQQQCRRGDLSHRVSALITGSDAQKREHSPGKGQSTCSRGPRKFSFFPEHPSNSRHFIPKGVLCS